MQAPGFWDDQERAASVSAEHSSIGRRLETFRSLQSDIDDLETLEELAEEDDSMAVELEEQRASIEARLAELEEARLFAGDYDAGDAVVTVNAGAGGTDSQDWAEMLLRMEMRWAERRGMKVEIKEASEGEEAGIKSATFIARGENAYGLFSAEKGVHRLVRISPYDAQSRRHTAFAGLEVAPLVEDAVEVEIEPDDIQIDTYRASGAGGQHVNKTDSAVRITHRPTGIVVQCQNERSQSSNRDTAMKMLKGKLLELEERRRQEEIAKEKGEAQDVGWGSQIRSYVLHPYTMVKDHRTNVEAGNAQGVLDGDLDEFVRAELLRRAGDGARRCLGCASGGSSSSSSTPSSCPTRHTSSRSSSMSTQTPALPGKTTWSPGATGILMPTPPHQSSPGPTASTMPCCGGVSCSPGGRSSPERRTRSGSSSLMTTWSKSGFSCCFIATNCRAMAP